MEFIMNRNFVFVLAGAGLFLSTPQTATGQALPDTIELRGIVRDFQESHVDFEVSPSQGYAHYTGNVSTSIIPGSDPIFVGPGIKLASQFRDSS
ncbi:MAG: hypothetical protein QQN46_09315, partial [Nitrosopumilus sp.]